MGKSSAVILSSYAYTGSSPGPSFLIHFPSTVPGKAAEDGPLYPFGRPRAMASILICDNRLGNELVIERKVSLSPNLPFK